MEPRALHWISEPGLMGLDDASGFTMQQEELSKQNHFRSQELISASYENVLQQSISSSESFDFYPSVYSAEKSMETSQRIYKADQFLVPDAPLLLSFNHSQAANIIYDQADVPADQDCTKRKSGMVNGETERKKMRVGLGQGSYAVEHIVAERRRREKLSQRFVALAAIIPGLTKMDKASVLGDAVKHIKALEERVKSLEEEANKIIDRSTVEITTMTIKPSHDPSNIDCESPISSVDNNNNNIVNNGNSSEIKIKICGKAALVKIHCENRKGILGKLVSCIEELHLIASNFSAVPFLAGSSSFLDITVAAQVEEGCFITVEDIAKKLNSALNKFNC